MNKFLFNLLCFLFCTYSYSQVINFPDDNFKTKLLSAVSGNGVAYQCNGNSFKVDANNDGEIEVSEALLVCSLAISDSNISDLTGIEFFTNLEHLQCNNNLITELDLSALTNMVGFDINNNQLTNVNLSGLSEVHNISFRDNQLTAINLLGLSNLAVLDIRNNQIASLNLDETQALQYLYCQNNDLSTIDLTNLENLIYLNCSFNDLTTLNIKNESVENLNFSDNENLQYICADGNQLSDVEEKIIQYGYMDCYANSLCNFNQGSSFYSITGNVKYDEVNDGCSATDLNYEGLMFGISDGLNAGDFFSNSSGTYQYNVQEGSFTLTPLISNNTYFNISPTSVAVIFPDESSPAVQDFCITPAGSYPDLKISIETINSYYDYTATYRINFSNQGTMTQSGFVNFIFDDNVIDFNSAIPIVSEQNTDELIWEFINLKPFETRSIDFILDFNVPPIDNGDILNFTGSISSDLTETTPNDNAFNLDHIFQCCILDVPSFEFSDYFIQYPNPTNDFLNLKMKKQIDVESIIIYNFLGQEVKKVTSRNQNIKIDVSNLKSGHYFIKILTSQKEFFTRFIRK
ncbi:T9SS type A sorting domain-containing protein [Winogradskyella sp. UBA3174]|uniref:T9SS type A sorting domain-containing protein n=1 Tax=Winogradskyella sp. UBA3174 TaxID=1947785 RepID=UPI0025E0E4E5|nr:T9SS type A sorting domain-containing protein [Winogradskyella sp. UBA3174]